jgi:hypothetical protein
MLSTKNNDYALLRQGQTAGDSYGGQVERPLPTVNAAAIFPLLAVRAQILGTASDGVT